MVRMARLDLPQQLKKPGLIFLPLLIIGIFDQRGIRAGMAQ